MRFSTNCITYLWYAALGNYEVHSIPSWPTFWSGGDTCASGHYLEKGLLHCAHDLSVWYQPRQLWRTLYASSSWCSWCCFKHRLEAEDKTACDVHHFFLLYSSLVAYLSSPQWVHVYHQSTPYCTRQAAASFGPCGQWRNPRGRYGSRSQVVSHLETVWERGSHTRTCARVQTDPTLPDPWPGDEARSAEQGVGFVPHLPQTRPDSR